ncbi:MAG: SH3 domain-containing protein [Candidatus Omnitrophota bacterium]
MCQTVHGEEKFPFLGQMTTDRVNVRAGQSVNYERLCQLNKNDEVVVVGKSFSWYKIKLPSQADAFISAQYVERVRENIGKITTSLVNIRAGKGEPHTVLGQMKEGALVNILAKIDDWYKIEPTDESFGWVNEKFVALKSYSLPAPRVVQLPSRSVYQNKQEPPETQIEVRSKSKPAIKKEQPEPFAATGYIEDLGRVVPDRDIRYKLMIDGEVAYYLKVPRHIIDYFVHYKARVQGKLMDDSQKTYEYPVIIVERINLVL